jgi:acetylornithine deacetylase/succinyl-diaminopimelate desuccinylase-like protein
MPASSPNGAMPTPDKALAYVESHRDAFLDDLKDLLRIPSISTLHEHRDDVRRAAQYVADQLSAIGFKKVRLIQPLKEGHPLVYGEWLEAEGKPTILLYGHYDVQPVDPIELWKSPPFEPEVRGGNLYARGAVDDKGQMLALVKALESLMRADGTLPVNIKILIEGEEEAGGASIEKHVRERRDELACDAVLVADTGMPAPGVPAIIYSLRGILYVEIVARGAKRDLHSGVFGGIAPNPFHALALVLAGLKGADGKIKIPGLYRKVKRVSEEERALWARNPVDEAELLKREMGVDTLVGEEEYPPLERMWARPTLEVHGFIGGFTGEGAKTVIPAEGRVKVSLRLPPQIKPDEALALLKKRVAALCPPGVKMTVEEVHGGSGVLIPLDNVYMRVAERALEQEWGKRPVFMREGGSIPVGALFDSELQAPVIFIGTGLPDDNIHAPNEKYNVSHYYHLMRQAIRFLHIAGADPAVASRPRARKPAAKTPRRAVATASARKAKR